MLACNNDILITLEKSQFNVINLKSHNIECIKIEPLTSDEQLGFVLAGAVSPCNKYICVSDDFKRVILYVQNEDSWVILRKCTLDRRCSNIKFSFDSDYILTADKSGYLLRIPLEFEEICLNNDDTRLKWVALGHVSVLTDFELHPTQRLIATADRDEKIRLSHYPHCHEIYSFLLGHSSYLTQIAFSADGKTLYSAAADGYVIVWDLLKKTESRRVKYWADESATVPVVTRMFVHNYKLILFFKNECHVKILSIEDEITMEIVDVGVEVVDVGCNVVNGDCHFYVLASHNEDFKLSEFIFDDTTLKAESSWVNSVNLGALVAYGRSRFLDGLCKVQQDKSGLEIYYEKKEKRMKRNGDHLSSDEDN